MHTVSSTPLQRARQWVNRSLFNTPAAGAYFEYLVEGVAPSWSLVECKARVVEVIRETADTQTWVLRPSRRWKGFVAGQHVHVVVQKHGAREMRTFSLSSSPARFRESGTVSITVKRVPDGRVTGFMHDHLVAGDVIVLSSAAGAFTLGAQPGACAYLAAGSGITPVMSHLRERVASNTPGSATLIYFANTRRDFIFGEELRSIHQSAHDVSVHFVASRDAARDTADFGSGGLPQTVLERAHVERLLECAPEKVFVCGPHPFRQLAKQLLGAAGFDGERIVEESFGLPPIPVAEGEPVVITFATSDTTLRTERRGTLLELAEGAGLSPRFGCRMGICHTCKCTKRSGRVRNVVTGELSDAGEEEVQLCISVPVTNVELGAVTTTSVTHEQDPRAPRDLDPRWERPTLTPEQFDGLARDLDQIRADVLADRGDVDARYIKRMIRIQRTLEVAGRCLVQFGMTPFTLVPGVLALGLSKILDNMAIGHNVLHGQFDWMNDPKLNSRTFDWDNTCDRESWQRTHNHEHHTFTNVLGKDRDFGYALFRLSDDVKWRPPHRIQLIELGILSAAFQWFVALHEMEVEKLASGETTLESKRAYIRDTRAKILRVVFKDYLLFPLLAGPFFLKVLLCNLLANLIRNVWASSVIFLGHFPHQAQTFTEDDIAHESRGQWYLRQMLGSSNIEGGHLMHVLTGQLSFQIEHHLFPDLPANRYEEIAPRVREVCTKYGIAYNTGPFLRQYGSFLARLLKYSARPSDERRVDPRYVREPNVVMDSAQ